MLMGSSLALESGRYQTEQLGRRPARFATDEAMDRLDKARAVYDPDGLFNSWMGRL